MSWMPRTCRIYSTLGRYADRTDWQCNAFCKNERRSRSTTHRRYPLGVIIVLKYDSPATDTTHGLSMLERQGHALRRYTVTNSGRYLRSAKRSKCSIAAILPFGRKAIDLASAYQPIKTTRNSVRSIPTEACDLFVLRQATGRSTSRDNSNLQASH